MAPAWSWTSVHDAAVVHSEDPVELIIETLGSDLGNQFGEVTPGAQIAIAGSTNWATTVVFTDQDEALAAINESIGRDWEYGGKWP